MRLSLLGGREIVLMCTGTVYAPGIDRVCRNLGSRDLLQGKWTLQLFDFVLIENEQIGSCMCLIGKGKGTRRTRVEEDKGPG